MKHNQSYLMGCLLLMFSYGVTNAQPSSTQYFNSTQSVTLRSDYPSKSVLVSNLFEDRVGDMSPIIGAVAWADSGKQLQCRSLLEFNYMFVPRKVINDPSLIVSAELILYPVQLASSNIDADKPGKIIIRRVLQTWEDTSTMWLNQPPADSTMQVTETIKKKLKMKPVSIDVTGLVMDMLRYGNQGFMICNEPSEQTSNPWFASPKNDDESIRPLLVIHFKNNWNPLLGSRSSSFTAEDVQREMDLRLMRQYAPVNNTPNTVPIKEPVATEPVKTNPTKD